MKIISIYREVFEERSGMPPKIRYVIRLECEFCEFNSIYCSYYEESIPALGAIAYQHTCESCNKSSTDFHELFKRSGNELICYPEVEKVSFIKGNIRFQGIGESFYFYPKISFKQGNKKFNITVEEDK